MTAVEPSASPRARTVLADGWYGWLLPGLYPVGYLTRNWPGPVHRLVKRVGPLRALIIAIAGRSYDALTMIREERGWRSVVLLCAVLPGRKLIVLHFIDHPPRRSGAGAVVDRIWRPIECWALRRGMLQAQVLSKSEPDLYARRFGVEANRFSWIPLAWRQLPPQAEPQLPSAAQRTGVIAAGRSYCDWPTLFAAARGERWPLIVVCTAGERPLVDELNRDGRARVFHDIPPERVHELLAKAAVCAITMYDNEISQGHTRLRDAVDAGTPIVASRTRSLEGYVEDGSTAVLVAPEDPGSLRRAINTLLLDEAARQEMAQRAWTRAGRWTWEDYLVAIDRLVRGLAA